jgi:outer membrane biogenesis lipoprotein LolB
MKTKILYVILIMTLLLSACSLTPGQNPGQGPQSGNAQQQGGGAQTGNTQQQGGVAQTGTTQQQGGSGTPPQAAYDACVGLADI